MSVKTKQDFLVAVAFGAVFFLGIGMGMLLSANVNTGFGALGISLILVGILWLPKMRAARIFSRDDKAVSPVIAVILMVAITVVLAATVFVLVSDIGGNVQSSAPAVSWSQDETQDRLVVNTAAMGADWNRLEIQADKTGLRFALNANAGTGNTSIGPYFTDVVSVTDAMNAGEYLDFCGTAVDVTITIRDATANALVGTWRYLNAPACA